jgi:hypothetical protein
MRREKRCDVRQDRREVREDLGAVACCELKIIMVAWSSGSGLRCVSKVKFCQEISSALGRLVQAPAVILECEQVKVI